MGQNGARIKLRRTRHECSIASGYNQQKLRRWSAFPPVRTCRAPWASNNMGARWSRSTPVAEEAPAAPASTHATGPPAAPAPAPTPPPSRKRPVTEVTEHGSALPPSKRVAMDLSDRAIHLCAQDAILAVQNRALRCGPPSPPRVALPACARGVVLVPCAGSAWWMARRRSTCWTGPRPWARRERVAAMASWPRARSSTAPPSSSSTGC